MATPTQTHNVLPNPKGEGLDPKEIDIDTNYKGKCPLSASPPDQSPQKINYLSAFISEYYRRRNSGIRGSTWIYLGFGWHPR